MSILVIDDDPEVRNLVAWQLEADGLRVELAPDAATAIGALNQPGLQLVVLDLSLPDRSGLDVLRHVRATTDLPVIILSARSEQDDRIRGLELGADDYVTKPFSPRELALRVTSVLRRACGDPDEVLTYGPLTIDGTARRVSLGDDDVVLTPLEFELLHFCARNPRRAYSKEQLLRQVWRSSSAWQSDATVTQHVHRLRTKLECAPDGSTWMVTIPGGRYLFDPGEHG